MEYREIYIKIMRKGISLQKTYPFLFFSFIFESPYLNHHVQVPFLIPSSANRQIRQRQPGWRISLQTAWCCSWWRRRSLPQAAERPKRWRSYPWKGGYGAIFWVFYPYFRAINNYFLQKYKKYLVNSRKSCNFAPQFVKWGVFTRTFLCFAREF